MIESAILNAIKKLIVDNRDTLTTDLAHQGSPIILRQVTTSGHTAPITFPFVSVMDDTASTRLERGNARGGKQTSSYRIVISILSRADVQPNDDQAYEVSDNYHKLLGDRIAYMIVQQTSGIEDTDTGARFKVDFDEDITKSNGGSQYQSVDGTFHSQLVSEIRFSVKQECVDNEKLYNQS
jgi:hypothetical protein